MSTKKSTELQQTPQNRVTLSESIMEFQALVDIVEDIRESEEDEAVVEQRILELLPVIDKSVTNIEERVDKRIRLIEYSKSFEDKIKDEIEYLKSKAKALENMRKRVLDHTKALMEQFPEIRFEGRVKKFKICNNGGKLPIRWAVTLDSVRNVIPEEYENYFDPQHVEVKTVKVLKKDEFENDLLHGLESPAAYPEPRGTHLRIM